MTCPNCGAPVADPEAAFCSRCGVPLGSEETEATTRIETDATEKAGSDTTRLKTPPPPPPPREEADAPLLSDYATAVRSRFLSSWLDPISAACLSFLILLALGALFLVAAKLQYPGFGTGADPIEVLSAVAILGLAVLRAPIYVDDVVVTVLPLGALLAVGIGIAWATSVALKDADRSAMRGASVGIPFALICWLAALVFRFGGTTEVHAGAWSALFFGLVWGAGFGALGGLRGSAPRRGILATISEAGRGSAIKRGFAAAAIALVAAGVLGAVAMLLWVIVGLIRGAPGPQFSAGDAGAAFVYLLAFAPNVIVTLTALGMGAPVYVGARVTVAGAAVGDVRRIWLFGDAPGYAGFLILIPAVACSLAGFWARGVSKRDEIATVIGTFALTFAAVLTALAWLGQARLGASLLGRGFAQLDVNAPATFLFALLWAAVAGAAGWFLADRSGSKETE